MGLFPIESLTMGLFPVESLTMGLFPIESPIMGLFPIESPIMGLFPIESPYIWILNPLAFDCALAINGISKASNKKTFFIMVIFGLIDMLLQRYEKM
jgi:hypothetical protein